jgi:hypothetical protein
MAFCLEMRQDCNSLGPQSLADPPPHTHTPVMNLVILVLNSLEPPRLLLRLLCPPPLSYTLAATAVVVLLDVAETRSYTVLGPATQQPTWCCTPVKTSGTK